MDSVYITGTDTGVGKTVASCVLLHALRARGLRMLGMKPVASGCETTPDGLRNEDALALAAAGSVEVPYDWINPWALPEPTAPEFAARAVGVTVTLPPIEQAFARLRAQADAVLVEGAGGWLSPVNAALMQADVARALRLDVVLVVGLRLGCINHALLSVRAIESDGLRLAGWIANAVDPALARTDDTLASLRARIAAPYLGCVPFGAAEDPAAAAGALDLSALGA